MAVLDLANNYTIEVKFCTYNVVSVIINVDANLFYLFIICLFFIYNIITVHPHLSEPLRPRKKFFCSV